MRKKDKNSITTATMASYGTGKFLAEFLTGAYGIMVFYFYETELKLGAAWVTLATVIYSIWNAVNDPLIGYLTGKTSAFTKRFGKRSPWILAGLLLCSCAFVAIFAVPRFAQQTQLRLFLWMVLFVCLYDGCYSLWEVNYQGVFPDKFRTVAERTKTAAISTTIGVFGIALGAVLPPLFYTYGKPESFIVSALIIAGIGVVGAFLLRSGVKETPEMTERYNRRISEEQAKKEQVKEKQNKEEQNRETGTENRSEKRKEEKGFFKSLVESLKYRELVALLLMLFLYQSACMCMTSSVNYVVNGVLGMKSSATTPIFAGMLAGALVSILVWKQVSKKIKNNNQKLLIITSFFMAAASFAMLFADSQMAYALGMFVWGLGFGGFWTFMVPAMADVVDSIVVKQKRRDDGIIMGVRAFFMRLSYASQAVVFWLCHKFTGYNANISGMQEPTARFGIKLHISLVPAVFFALAAVVMILLNPLTPEKIEENRKTLRELDL